MSDLSAALQLMWLLAPSSPPDLAALLLLGITSAAYFLGGKFLNKPSPYHYLWFEKPTAKFGDVARARQEQTRDVAQKLTMTGEEIVIFWGSQSGTAESFAIMLAREITARFAVPSLCANLADYDADTIMKIPSTKLAIFILSTYGEGDPSDNAIAFWDWVQQLASSATTLKNLRYVAIGLGNSNYRNYNRVIDVVTESLDAAHAQSLMPVGKADDACGGTEKDFLLWKRQLFEFFQLSLHFVQREVTYTPNITVFEDEGQVSLDTISSIVTQRDPITSHASITPLRVRNSRFLCPNSTREYLHLELDMGNGSDLRYLTGDHIAIYPANPDVEIEILLRAIGYDIVRARKPLLVQAIQGHPSTRLPSSTTLENLLRHHLEICAPVSREILRVLVDFSPSEGAREFLQPLIQDEGALINLMANQYMTLGRILALAAPATIWDRLPLSLLLEAFRKLKPRYYSISSSSAASPKCLAITVGVVASSLRTPPAAVIPGVASTYLAAITRDASLLGSGETLETSKSALTPAGQGMTPRHMINAIIRPSSFKLPLLSSTPIVMLAAGTGIAPFRAFVLERTKAKLSGQRVGRMLLFYGCHDHDNFLYRDEIAEAEASLDGILEVIPAFSRLFSIQKAYVQHKISEHQERLCDLITSHARIFVCGRVSMAQQVAAAVKKAQMSRQGWDDAEGQRWIESMKYSGQWLEDVWG